MSRTLIYPTTLKSHMPMKLMLSFFLAASSVTMLAAEAVADAELPQSVQITIGVSGLWILANISYAGMRAQNNPSVGWRILAFLFGFPGTLLTYLAVSEGGERAYGIEIPKKR